MMGSVDDGSWFCADPLETPNKVEDGARLHFSRLRKRVFSQLQVDILDRDVRRRQGLVLTELRHFAGHGPEELRSACLGLMYVLLTGPHTSSPAETPFWDYLTLVRSLDNRSVAVRTMLVLARQCHRMHEACWPRFLAVLAAMAEARWPDAELVFLALQREACPGGAQTLSASVRVLTEVLRLASEHGRWLGGDSSASVRPAAARLTFLWLLRWASALSGDGPSGSDDEELRSSCLQVAAEFWESSRVSIVEAGPALLWALTGCRSEPCISEVWRRAIEGDIFVQSMPQDSFDNLLGVEEQKQLQFVIALEPGDSRERRYLHWFLERHCKEGVSQTDDSHLADIILWAITAVEAAGRPRPEIFHCLWKLASDAKCGQSVGVYGKTKKQAQLAFLFAACRSEFGFDILVSVLGGANKGARADLVELATAALPAAAILRLMPALADIETMQCRDECIA